MPSGKMVSHNVYMLHTPADSQFKLFVRILILGYYSRYRLTSIPLQVVSLQAEKPVATSINVFPTITPDTSTVSSFGPRQASLEP
jgi:hypothetical protein